MNDAKAAFDAFAEVAGADVGGCSAEQAVELMLAWYQGERADDVELSNDGDMLLYQWGTHDWGDGPSFQLDITRQLISVTPAEDDDVWQLSLTMHFEPTAEARAVARGERWCEHPDGAEEMRRFILGSAAMAFARDRRPDRVDVTYEVVG